VKAKGIAGQLEAKQVEVVSLLKEVVTEKIKLSPEEEKGSLPGGFASLDDDSLPYEFSQGLALPSEEEMNYAEMELRRDGAEGQPSHQLGLRDHMPGQGCPSSEPGFLWLLLGIHSILRLPWHTASTSPVMEGTERCHRPRSACPAPRAAVTEAG